MKLSPKGEPAAKGRLRTVGENGDLTGAGGSSWVTSLFCLWGWQW